NLDNGSAHRFAGLLESFTFDGGKTWTTRTIADGNDSLGVACCDNSLAFDRFGNLFMVDLLDHSGAVPVYLSTDGGVSLTRIHTIRPTPPGAIDGPAGPTKSASRAATASADQPTVTTGFD